MAAVRKRVLLGLRDSAVKGCPKGPAAWTASKMGGVPVYCPLEGSPFHRLLYVFACARRCCNDNQTRSWKVFRSQCLQVPEKETRNGENQGEGLAAENWCEGSHDWGSDTEETPPPPPPSDLGRDSNDARALDWTDKLQALHLQDSALAVSCPSPSGEGPSVPTEVPQFQPYYISVAEEDEYGNAADLDHAHSLLQEYQQREGVDMQQLLSVGSNGGDEKYEKTKVSSGDPTFYKFMKRISVCQEQILRYSWSGEPLFLSCPTFEVSEVPVCSVCGGQRAFEFQLMPALVSMLNSANLGLTVEFGTILVYTCKQSCWPPNQQMPVEEFCVIQEDPDAFLFK